MKHLSLLILTGLTLVAGSASAAEATNASTVAGVLTNRPLSWTVGIHVVSRTVNPDKSTYHQIIPELTAEDDKFILTKLNAAREEALDVKNADQLGPIFEPYKTEIEKYITAHHRDWKTAYKAFVAKRNVNQGQE